MVHCPECATDNHTPTRTWRIPDEPTRAGRFNERSVGIFQCVRCGTTFPHVVGTRRLVIVDANDYYNIKTEIEELRAENHKLKEKADIVVLQTSLDALEKEVSELHKEKKELETKLSQVNGSLDQLP